MVESWNAQVNATTGKALTLPVVSYLRSGSYGEVVLNPI